MDQQRDYLFQICFGVRGDELDRFISRAYRDMNRTFRGIRKLITDKKQNEEQSTQLLTLAKDQVRASLLRLKKQGIPQTGTAGQKFDVWHRESCERLIQFYTKELGELGTDSRMTYGQVQKWLNMTIKYGWVCGGADFDWLADWCAVAHVPVDEVILVAAVKEGAVGRRPCRKWSKWNDATEYVSFQAAVRCTAAKQKKSPLELEFAWWAKYRPQVTGDSAE